jgi:hypothetical protein
LTLTPAEKCPHPSQTEARAKKHWTTNSETSAVSEAAARCETSDQPFKFQIPLDIIGSSVSDLGGFPYQPGERSWHGNTLFVKGAKSKYINKNNIPIAEEFFPGMSLGGGGGT